MAEGKTGATTPTQIRLLDAVESICVTSAPTEISMRRIADEVGLSVGAAYRHYESREALIGAALDRMAERITSEVEEEVQTDSSQALFAVWRAMERTPAFARMVTWYAAAGSDVTGLMQRHPLMAQITQSAAGRGVDDPTTAAAVAGMLIIAGGTYTQTINRTAGRERDDPRLREAMAEMLSLWLERHAEEEPD